jgi:hypothetical protein
MTARWARVLPGLWAGVLLCIALIAAPAVFAILPGAEAGRVVSRIFVQEAWLSLALAAVLLLVQRSRARVSASVHAAGSADQFLLWGIVLCTLLGYFAVRGLMPAARAGHGPFTFAQLHAVSTAFFGVKTLLVLLLAWRETAADRH